MTDKTSLSIGSHTWLGVKRYEPGSEYHTRATGFFDSVDWSALASIASQNRGAISCKFAENFSVGHFNMTRRLDFLDDVSWAARVRFPSTARAAEREALPDSKTMEIEVASIKFFRSKSSIPVPAVHAYDFSAENKAGAPFIMMDYIHGSVASELRIQYDCAVDLFGTPEQDRKFRDQMARIQATISSFEFPQIGGIYYNEDEKDFYVGPELQTGLGPWTSATDYYDDLTYHLLKSTWNDDIRESQSFMLPSILNFLLRICGKEKTGPFRLTNQDFGAHNILVDENFDIVGVIDFDGVMAAPLEVVAQYPRDCGLDVEPHGVVDTRPLVMERVAHTLPKIQSYKDTLARHERDLDTEPKIAKDLATTPASVYRGMMVCQQQQDSVHAKWMKSCLHMLKDLAPK